jgi:hypothetical protein
MGVTDLNPALKRTVICLLFAILAGLAQAEAQGVSFSIRFHEKRIYYLGDAQYPVLLEAALANESANTFRFRIAENRFFNLDFEVSTPSNQLLDHAQKFIRSKNSNQPVFMREVTLEPGERYSITVNLNEFVEFRSAGLYTVQGLFYPELSTPSAIPLRSNTLSLSLRPAVVFPEEKARIEAETGALLAREPKPPDEVVTYTLQARQKSQWEKFFLYLDLESLYQASPSRRESYRRLSQENRRAALEGFRRQLMERVVDSDIVLIPSQFEVQETRYTPFEATVQVLEKFSQRDFTELKRFTYYLTRRDLIWLITGYETVNLGTE